MTNSERIAFMREIGSRGGKATAARLNPEQRKQKAIHANMSLTREQRVERARRAIAIRWGKRKRSGSRQARGMAA